MVNVKVKSQRAVLRVLPVGLAGIASLALSSCAVVDALGPTADPKLAAFAAAAQRDSDNAGDALSSLRYRHASALLDEVHRICGLTDEGNPPSSCDVDAAMSQAPALPTDDVDYAAAILAAPPQSRDLLIEQAIEVAAASPVLPPLSADTLEPTSITPADQQALVEVARTEQTAEYAVTAARAFSEHPDEADARAAAHAARALVVTTLLGAAAPAPAAGYELDSATLDDDYIDTVERDTAAAWSYSAASATTPAVVAFLINGAAQASAATDPA